MLLGDNHAEDVRFLKGDEALKKIANDAGAMVYDVSGSETYFVDEQTYAPVNIPFAETQSRPRGFYALTTELPGPTDVLSLRLMKMRSGLAVAAFVSVEDGEAPRLEIVQ